ncbi:hypothetical protein GCM10027605_02290 [Micromonospora zhanjiangensis]
MPLGNLCGTVGQLHQLVLVVDEDDPGAQRGEAGVVDGGVRDDDDQVTLLDEAGGGTVDPDDTGAPRPGDDVRLQALAVVDVHDVDELADEQVRGVHQVLVDGERTHVVQVALGHHSAVDLRLEHGPVQGHSSARWSSGLRKGCLTGRRRTTAR